MKYFMAVYSAGNGYDRYFQMDEKAALHYYYEFLPKYSDIHVIRSFESGRHVHAPKPFSKGMRIYGEEMTDKELFRLRIKGEIEKGNVVKYFVSPTRPFGAITFGLQMEKHGVYEVPSALAYDLYVEAEAIPMNRMSYEHIDSKFENGHNVYVHNFVQIWGDEVTDKELFKMRINGDVKKEVVNEFNPTNPYKVE